MTPEEHHELPIPRTTLTCRYVALLVWCKSCRHQADADLRALVDAGRGDVPMVELRWKCARCGHATVAGASVGRLAPPSATRPVHPRDHHCYCRGSFVDIGGTA